MKWLAYCFATGLLILNANARAASKYSWIGSGGLREFSDYVPSFCSSDSCYALVKLPRFDSGRIWVDQYGRKIDSIEPPPASCQTWACQQLRREVEMSRSAAPSQAESARRAGGAIASRRRARSPMARRVPYRLRRITLTESSPSADTSTIVARSATSFRSEWRADLFQIAMSPPSTEKFHWCSPSYWAFSASLA